jgi:hypothetical protein
MAKFGKARVLRYVLEAGHMYSLRGKQPLCRSWDVTRMAEELELPI